MAGPTASIRRRLSLSLVAMISVSYGALLITTELVIRRDRLQRHERLVMATAQAIDRTLAASGDQSGNPGTPLDEKNIIRVLNDFSATRVLVWLSRPAMNPVFPRTPSVGAFFKDPQLLEAAGVNAAGMQKPRVFTHDGQTYFTCSMPLGQGLGVLRFLEDVGVSPSSRRENVMLLLGVWLLLVLIGGLLIQQISANALRPLLGLQREMDDLSLNPSGVVGGERVLEEGQPLELKGIVHSFNGLADRLQKAWTQQQLFMRSVSHELLTPVTLIGSNARRLSRRAVDLPEHERELIHSIESESGRADRLVRNLLDLARSDSGNLMIQTSKVEPYPLLQELVKDAGSLPWGSRIQLEVLDPADPVAAVIILADAERLRQCIFNVLENAAKYSPAESPIRLGFSISSSNACIQVQDYGPGIAPEERELVFQPFYRSDQSRGQKAGSGVGLAIVRLLIEKMGGTVAVAESVESGTTIKFNLPISREIS